VNYRTFRTKATVPTLQEAAASELYSSSFDRKSCSHYETDDRQVNSELLKFTNNKSHKNTSPKKLEVIKKLF
jgi:hypothetical protein